MTNRYLLSDPNDERWPMTNELSDKGYQRPDHSGGSNDLRPQWTAEYFRQSWANDEQVQTLGARTKTRNRWQTVGRWIYDELIIGVCEEDLRQVKAQEEDLQLFDDDELLVTNEEALGGRSMMNNDRWRLRKRRKKSDE